MTLTHEALLKTIAERDAVLEALKRIMLELPVYRDWLNPRVEKMCLDAIEKADGEPLRLETKRFG